MKWNHISTVLFAAGVFAAGFWGCGGDDEGSGGATSSSSSRASSTSSTTSSSSGAVSSSGSGAATDPYLAKECGSDGDCGPGGKCITSDTDDERLGGGAANGYCTRPCATDSDCPGLNSLCVAGSDNSGECFLGCEFGTPEITGVNTPLDLDKCRGREDLRCQRIQDIPVCLPTCGADSQCGSRFCDPRSAACVTVKSTGLADGAKCNPDAQTPECEGICVSFTDGNSLCSNICVLGGELESNDCGGLAGGLCAYRPSVNGAGDFGFCAPGCTAQSDCQAPNFWCFGTDFATNGFCFGTVECPNGQNDCGNDDPNLVCTDTEFGKFCLDNRFPLDNPGTGGAGGGGGGAGGGTGGTGGTP